MPPPRAGPSSSSSRSCCARRILAARITSSDGPSMRTRLTRPRTPWIEASSSATSPSAHRPLLRAPPRSRSAPTDPRARARIESSRRAPRPTQALPAKSWVRGSPPRGDAARGRRGRGRGAAAAAEEEEEEEASRWPRRRCRAPAGEERLRRAGPSTPRAEREVIPGPVPATAPPSPTPPSLSFAPSAGRPLPHPPQACRGSPPGGGRALVLAGGGRFGVRFGCRGVGCKWAGHSLRERRPPRDLDPEDHRSRTGILEPSGTAKSPTVAEPVHFGAA